MSRWAELMLLWSWQSLLLILAIVVVIAELFTISWIRHRYMDTPWLSATVQVVVGGLLVFVAGWLIGSA